MDNFFSANNSVGDKLFEKTVRFPLMLIEA